MNIDDLKRGAIIKNDLLWNNPIKINFIEKIDDNYIRINGNYISNSINIDEILEINNLENLEIISDRNYFSGDPKKFFLSLETIRYRYASLYDPLLAISVSKVDPLPHQIEAVYGFILKQNNIRFLIADDPGAGKTIMAGLVIKELKLRNIINRILIVCPGHLKEQWIRELKEKFDENFIIIDRFIMNSNYYDNIWGRENQIITSMDFARQDYVKNILEMTHFDLIIVDEAHKMSAYKYGNDIVKTQRYRLGELLSRISTYLLFLTATPHKGDNENFRLFLDLLEPGFFATNDMIQNSIKNRDNPLFIRRIKEELKDFDGKPLFLPRHVNTVKFSMCDEERELYNKLSEYVRNEYNKIREYENERRNIAFALTILQRRFASSLFSLLKSLERRRDKLKSLLNENIETLFDRNSLVINNKNFDIEEYEDLQDNEKDNIERKWDVITLASNQKELNKEIEIIENLISMTNKIINNESEAKISKLKELINSLKLEEIKPEDRKFIIFTESKDTLDFLEQKIKSWGYKTITIHGGMEMDKRIDSEKIFKNEADVLIATEAAGEGINLQFCNLMINFDIPWNPNRLEQRMGRIHRYGQIKEVYIYNLVNIDTREGQVLFKLFEKLENIRNSLGDDKVFDVLGEIIDSKKFTEVMINAATSFTDLDTLIKNIDTEINEEYIKNVIQELKESLATHYINYAFIKEMAAKARENRLIPEYTQNYFIRAFELTGGKIEKNNDNTFKISNIPDEIYYNTNNNEEFKKKFGQIKNKYPSITFDKEVLRKNSNVEFVSFGHPLFEAVMRWVENFSIDVLQSGAVFYDPDGKIDGYIVFYEGQINDGLNKIAGKRIFSYLFDIKNNSIMPVSPAITWDLKEADIQNINFDPDEIEKIKKNIYKEVIKTLYNYKDEIQLERNRQCEIKQKYGINSLKYLISKLDQDLIDLYNRKDKGEQVDIAIYNKQERKKYYERNLENLIKTIEREKNLRTSTPNFIGMIRVIPYKSEDSTKLSSDPEIEKIGMDFVMEYEKNNNRNPEDVSSQNLGYDIRSTDNNGLIRYIEVKARAMEGDIFLTQNEWFKAQRFGDDYYLYVVYNASNNPELHIIQNPVKNLKSEQKIELVRYIIKKEEILNKT